MARRERNPRKMKKKVCAFCVDKAETIDYKDVVKLKKYVKFCQDVFLATAQNIREL